MIIKSAVISCILLIGGCGSAPGDRRSDTRIEALDRIADRAVEAGYPGMTVALRRMDGSILTGAAGLADIAAPTPITPFSRIHAASTTKAITAAAALLLVDRGQLSLEATLPQVLSPHVIENAPHAAEITVRQLLLHTSGIYSPNNDLAYLARYIGPDRKTKPFWTSQEIVDLAKYPDNEPAFEPGGGSHYSDINYVLLSMIVTEASGERFKAFVQREIFDKLGMRDSYYLSSRPDAPRARGYTLDSEVLRTIGLDPELKADASGLIDTTDAQEQSDGAAGVITTVSDLARFAHALTQSDLLSENSRQLVLSVADRAQPGGDEALGILRAYELSYGRIVAAEGDGPGTNVVWVYHPDSNRIVVAAINHFGRWDENDFLMNTAVPAALAVGRPH